MKKLTLTLAALLVCGATHATQKADFSIREVRDPVQLQRHLNANAADAENRVAAVEGIVGTDGNVTLANGKTLKAIHSTDTNTLITDGKLAAGELSGDVAVARITTALTTPGPIGASTPAAGTFTGATIGKAAVASGVITMAGTTSGTATLTVSDTATTITANKPLIAAINGTVGATTPSTGAFTDLGASGTTTLAAALEGAVQATAGVISAGILPVEDGGTALSAGTSGGILGYTATGVIASSALLTLHGPLVGGGAGALPTAIAVGSNNQVLKGASGAAPAFGALVDADIPDTHTHTDGSIPLVDLATIDDATMVADVGTAVQSIGELHKSVITVTNATITLPDGDHGAGLKVADLPKGIVAISGVVIDLTVTNTAAFNAAAADDYYFALGTVTAADDNDLTGTEQNLIAKQTIDTDSGTILTRAVNTFLAAGAIIDGSGTALDIWLNAACPDANNSGANDIGVTGTITIWYTLLGDY